MDPLTIAVAFLAGLVSFLSPCVLPIIPGFLSYLAGATLSDTSPKRLHTFLASVFFVLGFGVVFSLFGVLLNTLLEAVAYDAHIWLSRAGGVIIIAFGLYLTGLLPLPFLEREYRFSVRSRFRSIYMTSFVFGAAFAAGWTPCVGAVLGSILGLAATHPGSASGLLLSYSLGLGVPFLLVGLFAGHASGIISRYSFALRYIQILFGFILVILGILSFTQSLNRIANLEILNRVLLQ